MHRTNRSLLFLLIAFQALAQKAPAPVAGGGGGGTGNVNTGTTTMGTPTNPSMNPTTTTNPSNDPFGNQPIFLAGKVMFDDGTPMNKDIRIERVCGGNAHTEANVDNSGHFSFQIGGSSAPVGAMMDASQSDSWSMGRPTGINSQETVTPTTGTGSSKRLNSEAALWGCELRAVYPGYRSDVLSLSGRRTLDDPNVGTIILHHLGNVQGTTISVTTAEAPKSAQKNFEKGLQAARKSNFDEAEKRLQAATEEYPKYAVAWFALGHVQEQQNRLDDARKSYKNAIEADKKYVSPLDQLALMAAHENKWQEAALYSDQVIALNPVEFPSSYWCNTVAHYNLNQDAEAVKSGKALVKLDTQHRFPEVNRLLAELAVNNKEYAEAADYLKAYLALVPTAKDADVLKQQLLKIEEASAQVKK